MVSKEVFYDELKKALEDGNARYYRNLVYIERKDYLDLVKDVINLFLSLKPNPSVAYGFVPWANGSKERMKQIKEYFTKFDDIDYANAEYYLGNTYDLVILDTVDNFQPINVGRLADLARGGGLIIMYTDNLINGKVFRSSIIRNGLVLDGYEKRFKRKLYEHNGIFIADTNGYVARPFSDTLIPKVEKKIPRNPIMPREIHELSLSEDQNKVIENFSYLLSGGKRALVLTAARGRGKSAAAGLSIAGLIEKLRKRSEKSIKITVTAPSISSASQVMTFAKTGLEALNEEFSLKISDTGYIKYIKGYDFKVEYVPPDAALDDEGELLIVDEAAALGVNYIDLVLRAWKKVALVTTVHGYEGSSKAFLRYLKRIIQSKKIKVRWIDMEQPLRYAMGDPIEKWLYDALLLDAEPSEFQYLDSVLVYEDVDKMELSENDGKLRSIYGIMVTAHYKNNPDDLMIMLDGVHHKIKAIRMGENSYVGACQIAEEGELSDNMIDIALKGGTFDGDLIPDRILKHVRIRDFAKLKGWRIVRIAVVPELQDKGFGTELLRMIYNEAKDKGIDWVGSSFMSDQKVLNFWIKNDFIPVHISPKKNEKLGDYPVVVIKPISEIANEIVKISAYTLKEKLLNTLHDVYFNMHPEIARMLLIGTKVAHKDVFVSPILLDKTISFLQGTSPYESSADALHMLTIKYFWDGKRDWNLAADEELVLIAKILQGKPWSYVATVLGTNRSQVYELIYSAVAQIMKKYYNLTADNKVGLTLKDVMNSQHYDG
ncbi:tRNA(Met) cytidine acetyltransferase TmcA [Sulfolobus tengchongensis]|uniref:tRNA(Met) cytidine acetyltransferase TmcA n=1 Tax=Sulfolobus tengchongensis TaxID=207809 RepID=A0AAX4L0L8_9CREN